MSHSSFLLAVTRSYLPRRFVLSASRFVYQSSRRSAARIDSTGRHVISKQQVAIARPYPGNDVKRVACVVESCQYAHITSLFISQSQFFALPVSRYSHSFFDIKLRYPSPVYCGKCPQSRDFIVTVECRRERL